jgi:hypothetical protein
MLAHFMLFSEADIELRFLMATSQFIKEESEKTLAEIENAPYRNTTSRFHKVSLGLVSAGKKRNKK